MKAGALLISRAECLIFCIVFLSAAFFTEDPLKNANFVSRFLLTKAIVDNHTFQLDDYKEELGYDYSFYKGHYFSDKPPGSSFLMIPSYVLIAKPALYVLKKVAGRKDYDHLLAWLVQVFSLSILSAGAFVVLYRLLLQIGVVKNRFLITLLGYFGTLMFPYSTLGSGEMYVVPFLLAGIYLLFKARSLLQYFLSGLSFATAFVVYTQTFLIVIITLLYLLFVNVKIKKLLAFISPLILAVIFMMTYNYILFGNTFSHPVLHWAHYKPTTMQFEIPTVKKIGDMLFLPWKGLFFYTPFLLLSFAGARRLFKKQSSIAIYLLACFLSFFLFFSFDVGWEGGTGFGFRYIIPVLPFLFILVAVHLASGKLKSYELLLIISGVGISVFGTITSPRAPSVLKNPLIEHNLPYFLWGATNNIINHIMALYFNVHAWLFRLSTTVVFFVIICFMIIFGLRVSANENMPKVSFGAEQTPESLEFENRASNVSGNFISK